jgi:hypothetical protein
MKNLEKLIELAQDLPESVKGNAVKLLTEMTTPIEGVGDTPLEWKPPFLRLVQGTTDRGSIPKSARIGDFVIGETLIEKPLVFIPLQIWNSRQYWDPDQTSNQMLCWSPDALFGKIGRECKGCAHAEWVENEGSDCGKTKSLIAITGDLSAIFMLNFSKSNYKIGTELHKAMTAARVNSYQKRYGLNSITSTTAKNVENFKIEVLSDNLRNTPAELFPFLRELFTRVSSDRKASIEIFYELAKRRANDSTTLKIESDISETKLLENSTTTIEVVSKDQAVSPLAAKYKI